MTLKLHGMTYSNYYNMVKTVLLEQQIAFEEVHILPNQEAGFLQTSPMGKVPCLETPEGFLTESGVIMDYLDGIGAGASLYPQDAFARAKVQEIIRYLELYIELPARRLYGDAFFNKPTTEQVKSEVRASLDKGFAALAKLAKFQPYLLGAEFGYADIYFRFSVATATLACKKSLGWNALGEIADIKTLLALVDERDSIKQVLAQQQAV